MSHGAIKNSQRRFFAFRADMYTHIQKNRTGERLGTLLKG